MNTKLLNAINTMLVDFANEKGIVLADEFGTRDNFAKFVISFTIKQLMQACKMDVTEAYDIVMGDGAFTKLANDVWQSAQTA